MRQCTVPGGNVVPGTVVQVLRLGSDDYQIVAIDGTSPHMPLSWLILLAGWSYSPTVGDGQMQVKVVSPEGTEVELTERSKTHYLDQDTFLAIMRDALQRCVPSSGMELDQLLEALLPEKIPCVASVVDVNRSASIRFLQTGPSRKHYMKKIVELQRAIEATSWPEQNSRTSIAGGSHALFLGAQTNRGIQTGWCLGEPLRLSISLS